MGNRRNCTTHSRTGRGVSLAAILALFSITPGCRSTPHAEPAPQTQPDPPLSALAAQELRQLAEAQRDTPDPATLGSPLPPELLPDTSPEARRSLAETLAEFTPPPLNPPPDSPPAWDAVRQYVAARERLAAGDPPAAVTLLQSALRADPDAPTLWRELGEAQHRQGNTAAALVAFQEAVRRGLREPRVFWILARDAHASGRHDDAVRLLASARAALQADADPGLPFLIDALLGEALLAAGRTAAGIEALAAGLNTQPHSVVGTRMRLELAELFRRRGELRLSMGDALARLGRFDEALRAYEHAADADLFDAWSPASRSLALLFHRGQTAEAAIRLLTACAESGGVVDDRLFPHLRRLSASPAVRTLAEDVLARIEASLDHKTPTLVSRLARARAAVATPADSFDRLRTHLARMPGDNEALRVAMALRAAAGPPASAVADLCDLALAIVRADPGLAEPVGAALADSGPPPEQIITYLRGRRSPHASLLIAAAQLHLGLAGSAWETLSGVASWEPGVRPAGEALAAHAAFESGRFADALSLAESLRERAWRESSSMELRLSAARALHAVRRSAHAADLLPGITPQDAPAAPGPLRRHVDAMLLRAEYLASAERFDQATELLQDVLAIDPHDERPYRALMMLYGPGGPLFDQARFTETARALRQHNPNARLFRWLAAQDLAQRHLWSRAERILRELAEEDPTDGAALGLLATAWEQILSRAESSGATLPVDPPAWLDRRAEARWGAPSDLAARVRVLAAMDRADEALALLEGAALPLPAWSMLRERILRDMPGRAAEADELARSRLEPLPRPIGSTLELAELHARSGRVGEAARALAEGLPPPEVPLSSEESARVANLAGKATQSAMERARTDPEAATAALALLRIAADRDVPLPVGLHQARLTLLLSAPLIDTSELASAAVAASRQHPQPEARWELSVAAQLASGPHRARTPAFLRQVVDASPTPSPDLVFEYFRAVGLLGDVDDAAAFLSRVTDPEWIRGILSRFSDDGPPMPDTGASPEDRLRADLAYRLGSLAYLSGDHERAARIYEIGLSFDPSHAWLCNDLGYHWVEEDRNLERAAELLERAFELMPDRASITDSLGWLRYKLGRLHDGTDERGRFVAGAVSLLTRAASLDDGTDNGTILDHLGDALWRAGERAAAVDRWTQADTFLRRQVQLLRGSTGFPPSELRRLESLQRSVAEKIRATREGREPPVAPLSASVAEPPAPR
jgi:tetratricopeptide (TPR) repeat protein